MLRSFAHAAFAALLPFALVAEEQAHSHNDGTTDAAGACGDGRTMAMVLPTSRDPAVAAWQRINMQMHADMSIDFTGDPDADFMRGMIPHHQGAIDMARLLLEHGTDADTRALATAIIRAQEEEIALMQAWLAARTD